MDFHVLALFLVKFQKFRAMTEDSQITSFILTKVFGDMNFQGFFAAFICEGKRGHYWQNFHPHQEEEKE